MDRQDNDDGIRVLKPWKLINTEGESCCTYLFNMANKNEGSSLKKIEVHMRFCEQAEKRLPSPADVKSGECGLLWKGLRRPSF